MKTLTCRNVNDGFSDALWFMKSAGVEENSRNGKVLTYPAPVIVEFQHPMERTHFCPVRDANPFFHVMEAMWMLQGRKDVEWPARFAANIANYSDDGKTLHGAYGYRWVSHFGPDQIENTIDLLREDRETRRAVIGMWDPTVDMRMANLGGKDVPCNTHIYFRPRGNVLDMTVMNRSNDLVWGLFGANVVHMSFLHEFIARSADFMVGSYYQMTNNLHVYEQHRPLVANPPNIVPYRDSDYTVSLTNGDYGAFYRDLDRFFRNPERSTYLHNREWFSGVLQPMYLAHKAYKEGNFDEALNQSINIVDTGWSVACQSWLKRRLNKKAAIGE